MSKSSPSRPPSAAIGGTTVTPRAEPSPPGAPLGPDSLTWRYLGDSRNALLAARAGILQVMHPAIDAGVREHSDFFVNPWNRVIRSAFRLLGLETYFTAGVKEVRAWTIHIGDTAPRAAGVIHTDFERGFIRAQTIGFNDFVTYKGEQGAKEAGKMRAEGKEYVVHDGDVMNFLFTPK